MGLSRVCGGGGGGGGGGVCGYIGGFSPSPPPPPKKLQIPFALLSKEMHFDSEATCLRTKQNYPGQALNPTLD